MPNPATSLDLIVVVSGSPHPVRVNVHQTLEHVVAEALQESGNVGQPPADWELRTEDGMLLDYTNYALWPPSLTFIDPRTREPASPAVRAPATTPAGVRDALVDGHPDTGRPFLCLPGIREYHNHPQHTGDDWLLHRAVGAG